MRLTRSSRRNQCASQPPQTPVRKKVTSSIFFAELAIKSVEGQPELLKSLQIGLNTGDFFLRLTLLVGLTLNRSTHETANSRGNGDARLMCCTLQQRGQIVFNACGFPCPGRRSRSARARSWSRLQRRSTGC